MYALYLLTYRFYHLFDLIHTAQNLQQYRCKISAISLQCCSNNTTATFMQLCAIGVALLFVYVLLSELF